MKFAQKMIGFLLTSDLVLPTILLTSYLIFFFLVRGSLPSSEQLVGTFASLYDKFGYEILFSAALLEALIIVNFFIPGQIAMALGIIFARTGQTELIPVVLAVSLGAILGYFIDYILGYYGFSDVLKGLGYSNIITEARLQLGKFGRRGLIVGFIHPNIGSLLALSSGTIKSNWRSFLLLSTIATFFWATFWSVIIYILGDIFLEIFKKYSILLILLTLIGMVLARLWRGKK